MWRHGHFHWNELMTRDVEGAKAFYGETIGWTFDAMPMPKGGTYWVAMQDGQPVAGVFDISAAEFEGVPEQWMAYLAVDDLDARVEKATRAGATVKQSAFDVPGVGRIAMLEDAGGAGIGWMTPSSQG
jgi:predicted enzyme related to lactoylglutathione lyase